jgi:hypothetical protein
MRNFRLTQLTWSLRRTDGASRQDVLRGRCVIRKQPDLGVHEPGIGERMRGGRSSAEASRARAWGRAPADRGGAAVPVAVVTSRTEAELVADVLRNNDLRAVVSAEMPADGSHSGSLAAPWTQPTGKARQSEILIRQLLAEAGASGISPELVSIDARGDWTIGDQAAVLHDVNGWIVFRFQARDLHLVMGSAA